MFNLIKHFKNKELFVALYFLLFIVGFSIYSFNFYNDLRALEFFLLIGLGLYGLIHKENYFSKFEFFFLIFTLLGFLFWSNYSYIFYELIKNRKTVPAVEKQRAKKEYGNSKRIAKRRINTVRADEFRQAFKSSNKWIK